MGLANYINYAMKSLLKNPILEVLQEIKITKILKQSNFVKRDVGYPHFQLLLHFLYMLIMQKRQSCFKLSTIYCSFSTHLFAPLYLSSNFTLLGIRFSVKLFGFLGVV